MPEQKPVQEWRTKLVGVSFSDRQELIKEYVANGQRLFFKHNYQNQFDPNAIEIYVDAQGSKMIGHVNKKMAAHIVARKNEGFDHIFFCERVTGETKGGNLGVNIRIIARK